MKKVGLALLAAALLAGTGAYLFAYQGGDVKDGGTISGIVKFAGTAPAPKKLEVTKDKEVCAKSAKVDQSLVVSNGDRKSVV